MQEQDRANIKFVAKLFPVLCVALLACGGDDDGGNAAADAGADGSMEGGLITGDAGTDGSTPGTNECRNARLNDCDEHATCTDTPSGYECECDGPAYTGDGKRCECADGYTEVDGACVGENGAACSDDDQCENGHCVDGICCASACDEPGPCQVADGASCSEDGESCEYETAEDGSSCDDGNACTEGETCDDGECGDGDEVVCDDDNVCTADSCDPEKGCDYNGEGITTVGCKEDDACGTNYACAGNKRGDCNAAVPVVCPEPTDACTKAVCDGETGCGFEPRAEGEECSDGNACTEGETCSEGECGGGEPVNCDDGNVCTDDGECDPAQGCIYTFNNNACDDGNECTTIDACSGGNCMGTTPVVCTALDQCHAAGTCDPATGECSDPNKQDGTGCNDGNVCTTQDQCTAGVCAGSGNACGDECSPAMNPCDDNASCNDPTNGPGDVQCTCNTGFSGNGITCMDIDECIGNPCGAGRGTCTQGAPGTYSCSCMAGFMAVNTPTGPTCVCDLNGTFAYRIDSTVSWPKTTFLGIDVLEAGSGTSTSWSIRKQTYGADGVLRTVVRACGGIAPDICDAPTAPFAEKHAYNQYEPTSFYDSVQITSVEPDLHLPAPLPGSAFVTHLTVALSGISLQDPGGAWPMTRANIAGGGGTVTNNATWVTYIENQPRGVTTLVVPPGGVSDDNSGDDDPPINFGATSAVCPRTAGGARYPYAYLPNPSLGGNPIVSVRTGGRLQSWLDGMINSCDRITGTVKGPDNGRPLFEGRFDACSTTTGACSNNTVNILDTEPQTQTISAVTFVIERVADNFTCDQARTWNYDP